MSPAAPLRPRIGPERPGDAEAIHRLLEVAFGQPDEAEIVDRLRVAVGGREGAGWISRVARIGKEIVGHILFTEVEIRSEDARRIAAGLAPMAVAPALQRRGIGTALVEAGLQACRDQGHDLVVVLGHPGYYPRFGFRPAERAGLRYEHEVPAEAFMARELVAGALDGLDGTVHYRPEFYGP